MAKGSTGRRRSSGKSSRKLKKNQNPGIAEEILLFGAFGVAVLLFLVKLYTVCSSDCSG